MPNLTVGSQTFQYPDPGTEAGWGEDATGWAEAVTALLAALSTPGDILGTFFGIQNNNASPAEVTGLAFNSAIVRAANVNYDVARASDETPTGVAESGMMLIDYVAAANPGEKWKITQIKNGDAGIVFTINDSGQIYYTTSDIGSTNYSGTMKFSAKVLNQ